MKLVLASLMLMIITGCSTNTINKVVCTGNGTCGAWERSAKINEEVEKLRKESEDRLARHRQEMEELQRKTEERQRKRAARKAECEALNLSDRPRSMSSKEMSNVEESVKNQLKDPWSARFRNVEKSSALTECVNNDVTYTGEVNAKNSMGGYVGFKKFVAGTGHAHIFD